MFQQWPHNIYIELYITQCIQYTYILCLTICFVSRYESVLIIFIMHYINIYSLKTIWQSIFSTNAYIFYVYKLAYFLPVLYLIYFNFDQSIYVYIYINDHEGEGTKRLWRETWFLTYLNNNMLEKYTIQNAGGISTDFRTAII